jgi:HK97 family phage major capsid protein
MPYNDDISRTDAASLIPEEVRMDLVEGAIEQSAVMNGLKQTTEVDWTNKYIDAEEIAAIIPIKKSTIADSGVPIWDKCKVALQGAFGKLIDQAVLYGTSIPATWTTDLGAAGLVAGALAASHGIDWSTFTDLYEAILGEKDAATPGAFGLVEDDGYFVTGSIAHTAMKRALRNCRDKDGRPIFNTSPQSKFGYDLDGQPCMFPLNGAISSTYPLICGDWSKLVFAIREDMTWDIGKEAVIQDAQGNIVYNLFQQNMVALRCSMRLGFALPHPVTQMDSGSGFPFAYLY